MTEELRPDTKEIEEGKIFALIAYIWILCIVTLLVKKDNKFAYFHARQGLVLFLLGIVNMVVSAVLPFISWVITVPFSLILLICAIYGIIQALLGNYAKIPLVAELADKIKI